MEGLLILVGVGMLMGVVVAVFLAPLAFVKATNTALANAALERRVEQLMAQLNELRISLTQKQAQAPPPAQDTEEVHQSQAHVEPEPEELHAPETEPIKTQEQSSSEVPETTTSDVESDPASEQRDIVPNPQSTLEQLRAARDAFEPEQPIAQDKDEEVVVPVEQAIEEHADGHSDAQDPEPISNPVSTMPIKPDEPARRLSIEEILAGKVFVWIGAVALVLTAAFLLKLGFDRNIITEPVRVIGAGLFGIALWCVGEWARERVGLVAQALCGAAVAVLYASVLAGHNLYGLFGAQGDAWAFGLMAFITAAAILLSLRHGPVVAILGMIGGFMLPPILTQDFGGPTAGMVLYLIAIEIGVLAVTGKRGWFGISAMTLALTIIWSLGYTLIGDSPAERTLTALLVLGTAGAYLLHTARVHRNPDSDSKTRLQALGLSIAATCSAIAIIALLAVQGGYTPRDLATLGLVAAGTLVLARLDARQIAMPFIAMGIGLLVLLANSRQVIPGQALDQLIVIASVYGGLFMLGGYLCLWGSGQRRAFTVLSAIAGPSFLGIIVYASHGTYDLIESGWPYTLMLAGVYALGLIPLIRRRQATHDWSIGLFAVLCFALVCAALTQALDHPRLAVCLALVSAIAALIDVRLFIRPLRLAACTVAGISAVLLVVPGPFDMTIQGVAVFNTLLPMYLLPAIAFGVMAWCASRAGSAPTAGGLTYLCCGTLGVMLVALTRNAYQPIDFLYPGFALYEWATLSCVLLLVALLGQLIADRFELDAVRECVIVCVGIGAGVGLISGLVASNPLFYRDTVGGWGLALGLFGLYAVPATLMWLWSRRRSVAAHPQLRDSLRGIAITLLAIFVGLQIRNGFQGSGLQSQAWSMSECLSYVTAAIMMGGFIQRLNRLHLQDTVTRLAGQIIFGVGVMTAFVGSVIVFNPLLNADAEGGWALAGRQAVLYVLPAALMWLWARGRTLADQQQLVSVLRATSITFIVMLIGQLIRNAYHVDDLHAPVIDMFECATYAVAWMLLGLAVHGLNQLRLRCTTTRATALLVFSLGLGTALVGNVLALNPLWTDASVGSVIVLNGLWYLYGPALIALVLLARNARRRQFTSAAKAAGYTAIGLSFMLLSLLVRQAFSGDGVLLLDQSLLSGERYAYSLAWVLFGGGLLVAGVLTRLDTLRYGSLAVLLLAVGKVFLIDTANLENLYRVFSFFGLGVTLIALGYLYQRLVFRRPNATHGAHTA